MRGEGIRTIISQAKKVEIANLKIFKLK